jgi:D-aspartate ligase
VSQPGAVIIGGYANGVSALRSVAREGVRTAVILTHRADIAHRSRYAHESHRVTGLHRRPDGLIDLLQEHAGRWRGWALIPTNDDALAALAEHRDLLSRWYPATIPPADVVQRVLHKPTTYRLAEELGIDVPRYYGSATRATAARSDIIYPVVVKPAGGSRFWRIFRRKLFVARNPLELVAVIDRVERAEVPADIFELVLGPDDGFYNYSVHLDRQGEPAAEFSFRTLRKSPPRFGDARAAVPAQLPELREPTIALLRRIGWQGTASVEYQRDPRDGRYRLMEITGRCFLSHGLATRSGVNYPLLTWLEYARHQRVAAVSNGWRGTWLHLHSDLFYRAFEPEGHDVTWRELARSYSRPWIDAVWSAADPAPFVSQCIGTLRKTAREIREGREMDAVSTRLQAMPHDIPTPLSPEAR